MEELSKSVSKSASIKDNNFGETGDSTDSTFPVNDWLQSHQKPADSQFLVPVPSVPLVPGAGKTGMSD